MAIPVSYPGMSPSDSLAQIDPASMMPTSALPSESQAIPEAPPVAGAPSAPVSAVDSIPADPEAAFKKAMSVGSDVKTTGLDSASKAGIAEAGAKLDANSENAKTTAAKDTALAIDKAGQILKQEEDAAAQRQHLETAQANQRAQLEQRKADAEEKAAKLRELHSKDYEHALFEDRGSAASWIAAISAGLGAFSATWNHTPNYAMETIVKAMDAQSMRERGRLMRQKEEIERTGGDVSRIDGLIHAFDTVTVPQQQAAQLEAAKQRRIGLLAKYGADQARIDGDKLLQQITEQQANREVALKTGLADHVERDNAAQNKLARETALGAGGKNAPDSEKTAMASIRGAVTAIKNIKATKEFSARDRAIVGNFVAAMRDIAPSKPEEFQKAIGQLSGSYYKQLSEPAKDRLNFIVQAAQDLERNLSGGAISPHEIANLVHSASATGGVRHLVQRARDMTAKAGAGAAAMTQFIDTETGNPQAIMKPAEIRAAAVGELRSATAKNKAALEWLRDNPGNPDAPAVLSKIRGN